MSACQTKISGQLVKVSGYRGQNLSPAKYLSFIVKELTEANGQTLATTLQSFHVINAEQTFPIEFASDINLQRDCPKRAIISVVGNDTEGFYWKPKLFGQSALVFDAHTTIEVMSPKF
jgi:hypothetical protein